MDPKPDEEGDNRVDIILLSEIISNSKGRSSYAKKRARFTK